MSDIYLKDGDYVFKHQVWLRHKSLSICVQVTDEGVVCDMYATDCEDRDTLGSTYAFFSEGDEIRDDVLGTHNDEQPA